MTSLEVGNCGDCPFILECEDKLQEMSNQKTELTQLAVDDSIDTVVAPAFMKVVRESPVFANDENFSFESTQDIAAAIRKNAAALLEDIDQQEELLVTVANAGRAACNGPLRMRATKDGVTTIATICNNPAMPKDKHAEQVIITRQARS